MSFNKVSSEVEKRALIDQFIANRQVLKGQLIAEKIGKQEFQREVALPLAEPITTSLKENQLKMDKKQDQMIDQLVRNQRAITDTDRSFVSTPGRRLPIVPAIAPTARRAMFVDVDRGFDREVLDRFDYKMPSELLKLSKDELSDYQADVGELNKRIGYMKKKDEITPEEADMLKLYNKTLRSMVSEHRMYQSHSKTGTGYKQASDYTFGSLQINPHKLLELRLDVYKNDKRVLSRKVDYDFIDLLTKRFNKRKTYSKSALTTFAKLSELADIKSRSAKFKNCLLYT